MYLTSHILHIFMRITTVKLECINKPLCERCNKLIKVIMLHWPSFKCLPSLHSSSFLSPPSHPPPPHLLHNTMFITPESRWASVRLWKMMIDKSSRASVSIRRKLHIITKALVAFPRRKHTDHDKWSCRTFSRRFPSWSSAEAAQPANLVPPLIKMTYLISQDGGPPPSFLKNLIIPTYSAISKVFIQLHLLFEI